MKSKTPITRTRSLIRAAALILAVAPGLSPAQDTVWRAVADDNNWTNASNWTNGVPNNNMATANAFFDTASNFPDPRVSGNTAVRVGSITFGPDAPLYNIGVGVGGEGTLVIEGAGVRNFSGPTQVFVVRGANLGSQAFLIFNNNASANLGGIEPSMDYLVDGFGSLVFQANSTSQGARLTNLSANSVIRFEGNSSAFGGGIFNEGAGGAGSGGTVFFGDSSRAQLATIFADNGGRIVFADAATASGTEILLSSTGILDISRLTTDGLTLEQISGESTAEIFLGSKELRLNSFSISDFAGQIKDGFASGDYVLFSRPDPVNAVGGRLVLQGGTLNLSGANTYSGGTSINGGTLGVANASALGTGLVTLSNDATLQLQTNLSVSGFDWVSGNVALDQFGASFSVLSVTGQLSVNAAGGNFQLETPDGGLNLQTYTLATFGTTNATSAADFSAQFLGANPNVTYSFELLLNPNSVQLSILGASATGPLLQNSAPVNIPTFADFIVNGDVSTGNPAESNTIRSLEFEPDANLTVLNELRVTTGLIQTLGLASISGDDNSVIRGGAEGLEFETADRTVVDPRILPGAATLAGGTLEKIGLGSLVLRAFGNIATATNVREGSLFIGEGGSLTSSDSLTVTGGATLGGAGVLFGDVVLQDTARLSPGGDEAGLSVGTLQINGNLTLGAQTRSAFELDAIGQIGAGGNDLVSVAGDLSLAGFLDIFAGPQFREGAYRLFNYTGNLLSNALEIGLAPSAFEEFLVISTVIAGQVNLIVTGPDNVVQFWDGDAGIPNNGAVEGGNGSWTNFNANFTDPTGLENSSWQNGTALFAGTAGVVTVDDEIFVQGIQFLTDGYEIAQGVVLDDPGLVLNSLDDAPVGIVTDTDVTATISANIRGDADLEKLGAGILFLRGENSYLGNTIITDGTLDVLEDGNLGDLTGNIVIDNEATLRFGGDFASERDVTLETGGGVIDTNGFQAIFENSVFSGSGGLTKTGEGILQIESSAYLGDTTVAAGTLRAGSETAFTGESAYTVASGAILDLNGFSNSVGSLAGAGVVTTTGIDSVTLLVGANNTSTTFSGVIREDDGSLALTKIGAGALTLRGANTYTGGTSILGGTLDAANDANLGAAAAVLRIENQSTLRFGGDFVSARNVVLESGGGVVDTNGFAARLGGGTISGTGSLTKTGEGILLLSGANTYTDGTNIQAGTLQTDSVSALGSGGVTLSSGILNPISLLEISRLGWADGNVQLALTPEPLMQIAGDLTNEGGVQTFLLELDLTARLLQEYTLLTYEGDTNFLGTDFAGEFIGAFDNVTLQNSFVVTDNSVVVRLTAQARGPLLQNSAPVFTPTFADFFVEGRVSTGSPAESNTINSLNFAPGSLLRVFNTLTVTSGLLDVANGVASLLGGRVVTAGDMEKSGIGALIADSDLAVGNALRIVAGSLLTGGNITAGLLEMSGDLLQINGHAEFSGTASLLRGSTLVFGQAAAGGGFEVAPGALLGGTGNLVGNVLNRGVLAPGASAGTLSIDGNFTQTSTGIFDLEIENLGLFDRLLVTGNAALGGTLRLTNLGTSLSFGQLIPFLQAGSISGDFDTISLVNIPAQFRARFLAEDGVGSALIAPSSYTLVAETGNQRRVAAALDSFIPARGDDRETVSIALDRLTADQYPAAFDQIAPTFHQTVANITLEQAFTRTQLLNQRMSSARLGVRGFQSFGIESEPLVYDKGGKRIADGSKGVMESRAPDLRWSTWAQGNGMFARLTHVSQVPNLRFNSGGFLAGADYSWLGAGVDGPSLVTGLYAGYQGTDARYAGGGTTRIQSTLFGGYASFAHGGFYADAVVGGGYHNYTVRRPIAFSTIDRTARSTQDGGEVSAALNLGYDWQAGPFTFGPIMGAQYTYLGIAPFTEGGAQSLNLRVGSQSLNSLRSTLGGRVAATWKLSESIHIIPEVRMLWQHEFLNNARTIGASLDGGSGPGFDYVTSAPGRDSVFAGAGVSAQLGERWNTYFFYNADFGRNDFVVHTISAGLGLKF